MCDRPNFEENEQDLDEKLLSLWNSWRNCQLNYLDKSDLGTEKQQIKRFLVDCKRRLEELLKKGC